MPPPSYDFTSRIIIDIRDGTARRRMRETARTTRRAGQSFDYAGRRGGFFRRTINTITKALTSMIGVLIAFNLLITGPQFALNLLRTGFEFAIKAVAEFEQRILGIQAILASTLRFDADPAQNFEQAGLVAEGVISGLADRAAEMVGSLEDAAIVFQTLLSSGAQRTVNSVAELVDLTVLLSNSIIGLTVGQGRQRQLAEETRSLFTGQIRATSLLARLLFKNRREMEMFFEAAKASGDLVERLSERLSGFVFASSDFATTFEGVKSSLETILQIVLHRALGAPGGVLGNLFDQLAELAKAIQDDDERFLQLTASVSASGRVIFNYATEIFGLNKYLNDSASLLDLLIALVPLFTQGVVYLIALFRSLGLAVIAVYQILDLLLSIIGNIIRLLRDANIFSLIIDTIRLAIQLLLAALDFSILLIEFFGNISDSANRVARTFKNLAGDVDVLGDRLENAASAYDVFVESGSLQDIMDRVNETSETVKELFSGFSADEFGDFARSDFFALLPEEIQRAVENLLRLRDVEDEIRVGKTLDLANIIETNKQLLRSVGLTRRQARAVRSVLEAAAEGFVPREIASQIAGQVNLTASLVRQRIREVSEQLRASQLELLNADLSILFLEDPDQIPVLEDQIISLQGEISALAAELAVLDKVALSFANTTLPDLGTSIANLINVEVFGRLFNEFSILRDIFDEPLGLGDVIQKLLADLNIDETVEELLANVDESATSLVEGLAQSIARAAGSSEITSEITNLAQQISESLGFVMTVESIADRIGLSLGDLITRIWEFITSAEGLTQIVGAIGDVVAGAFTSALRGVKSFGDFVKEVLGAVLITLGNAMLSSGIGLLIASIFNPALITSALALMAGGAAVIAAGVALSPRSASSGGSSGAGSGQTPEFSFTQQQIATQQHFSQAAESLRISSENMNEITQNIGGVGPGELFVRGADQAGGVTRVLAQDSQRSDRFASTREAARAFQGA